MATRLPLEQEFGVRVPGPQLNDESDVCPCNGVKCTLVARMPPDACHACAREPAHRRPIATLRLSVGQVRISSCSRAPSWRPRCCAAGCGGDDSAPIDDRQGASGRAAPGRRPRSARPPSSPRPTRSAPRRTRPSRPSTPAPPASDAKLQATQELQITRSRARSLQSLNPPEREPLRRSRASSRRSRTRSRR